jgi:hypothetical protein
LWAAAIERRVASWAWVEGERRGYNIRGKKKRGVIKHV